MKKYNIEESIEELKEKFSEIKKKPFYKSMRKGVTGIGYTFESLIGKKEDFNYEPDFKGIEIKTKIMGSKRPITLFSLAGKKDDGSTIYKPLIDKIGYYSKTKCKEKRLSGNVYANILNRIKSGFLWKLKIDLKENKLKLLIINSYLDIVDNSIYWNLNEIKERVITKLNYVALVKGVPRKYNKEIYYKYLKLNIYKLKNFNTFLDLIKKGEIFVCFNISYKYDNDKIILTKRNVSFNLNLDAINELFIKLY